MRVRKRRINRNKKKSSVELLEEVYKILTQKNNNDTKK